MANKKNKQPQVEIIKKEALFEGFIKLDRITANIPTVQNESLTIVREIHDHGNAVTVLPVDKKRRKALMVGQWRIPAWINDHQERIWEAPAGLLEKGESPEECAKREALEETGYKVSNLRLVGKPFASPGLVTEQVYIYLGDYDENSQKSTIVGLEEEGEDIDLKEFDLDELFTMLKNGEIYDAVTAIALYAIKEELTDNPA